MEMNWPKQLRLPLPPRPVSLLFLARGAHRRYPGVLPAPTPPSVSPVLGARPTPLPFSLPPHHVVQAITLRQGCRANHATPACCCNERPRLGGVDDGNGSSDLEVARSGSRCQKLTPSRAAGRICSGFCPGSAGLQFRGSHHPAALPLCDWPWPPFYKDTLYWVKVHLNGLTVTSVKSVST